jgi:hypothetical protein
MADKTVAACEIGSKRYREFFFQFTTSLGRPCQLSAILLIFLIFLRSLAHLEARAVSLSIKTLSLKIDKVGKKYKAKHKSKGGIKLKPRTWSVISGSLRQNVNFDTARENIPGTRSLAVATLPSASRIPPNRFLRKTSRWRSTLMPLPCFGVAR